MWTVTRRLIPGAVLLLALAAVAAACGPQESGLGTPSPEANPSPAPATTPSPANAPVTVPFQVNLGGDRLVDSKGVTWEADQEYAPGRAWGYVDHDGAGNSVRHSVEVTGTDDDGLWASERWGLDGYRVHLPDGTYDVRLLFAETFESVTGAGQRVFAVSVEGQDLGEVDVYAEVGFAVPMVLDARDVEVTEGVLEIVFTRITEEPMAKGIAVAAPGSLPPPPVPPAATPTPASAPSPTPMPDAPSGMAPLPLHINVGGEAFTDRGGNEWEADEPYTSERGWGYVGNNSRIAPYRWEYHGGVGHEPHSNGREGMEAYRFNLPDPPDRCAYRVEMHFTGYLEGLENFGERVFYAVVGQEVPGQFSPQVIGPIDPWTATRAHAGTGIVERVHYAWPRDGVLEVTFVPLVGEASLNGITVQLVRIGQDTTCEE